MSLTTLRQILAIIFASDDVRRAFVEPCFACFWHFCRFMRKFVEFALLKRRNRRRSHQRMTRLHVSGEFSLSYFIFPDKQCAAAQAAGGAASAGGGRTEVGYFRYRRAKVKNPLTNRLLFAKRKAE